MHIVADRLHQTVVMIYKICLHKYAYFVQLSPACRLRYFTQLLCVQGFFEIFLHLRTKNSKNQPFEINKRFRKDVPGYREYKQGLGKLNERFNYRNAESAHNMFLQINCI